MIIYYITLNMMNKETRFSIFILLLLIINTSCVKQSQSLPAVRKKTHSFALDEVQIRDKEFRERQEHNFNYIRSLDPDKYLSHFRRNAGISTDSKGNAIDNTNHYGGWEFLGSSTFGHYLSALSMMYKVTGEEEAFQKISYIIDELDYIQHNAVYPNQNLQKGVLVAFDRNDKQQIQEPNFLRTYDELRAGHVNLTSAPNKRNASVTDPYFKTFYWLSGGLSWYTNHKIFAGIRDAYYYADNLKAKNVFLYFCDWACWVTENLSEEAFVQMLYSEHGAMNEMLADAYAMTGDEKYLNVAFRFNEKETINPCMHGDINEVGKAISHTHANAQIPQFYGILKEYEYTGNVSYLKAAENFFDYVINRQSFVIGGNSEWEQFRAPNDIYSQVARRSAETCNTYNMLKIAKGLFDFTGHEKYIDYCERALYNHILASIHTKHPGAYTYFVSLEPGYFKTFSRPYDSHWCCVGTGMENHAKYGEFIYSHTDKDIYLNLYVASELDWKEEEFQMTVRTDFPYDSIINCLINASNGDSRTLYLRCPSWSEGRMQVKINDTPIKISVDNNYIAIERKWNKGDKIEIFLPASIRKEYMPGRSDMVSYFYGPVLLAGGLGKENMPEQPLARGENDFVASDKYDYKGIIPVFNKQLWADQCVMPEDISTLTFKSIQGMPFVPFYAIMDERYSVYWKEE